MILKFQLWDTQKNIEEDVKSAQKKEELEKEIRRDSLKADNETLTQIKKLSLWIFIIPFVAINLCWVLYYYLLKIIFLTNNTFHIILIKLDLFLISNISNLLLNNGG